MCCAGTPSLLTPALPTLSPKSPGMIKANLRKDDYICSTYRDHVHALSKGVSARKIMAELFGKKTGCCLGEDERREGLVQAVRSPRAFSELLDRMCWPF